MQNQFASENDRAKQDQFASENDMENRIDLSGERIWINRKGYGILTVAFFLDKEK